MEQTSFVSQHIFDSLRAALAEASGCEDEARRLTAQSRLRLLTMSNEETWELAQLISTHADNHIEKIHNDILGAIEDHRSIAEEWIPDISGVVDSSGMSVP